MKHLLLILCITLSGCGYRAPRTPAGMCLVTVQHSGPFCRTAKTYGYGRRIKDSVEVPQELLEIPFTRTIMTRYGPLDYDKRQGNLVPIWRRHGE